MKKVVLILLIAGSATGAILTIRKSAAPVADHSELMRRLHDPDWKIRQNAAAELASSGKPAAVRSLIAAAREEHEAVRATIHNGLSNIRDRETVEWLVAEGIRFPDRWTRYYSVRAIAGSRGAQCVDLLLPHLAKNYWQVQDAILTAIEPHRSDKCVPELEKLIAPGANGHVRLQALKLLGAINSSKAAEAVMKALPPAGTEIDPTIEWAVEDALSSMNDEGARKFMVGRMATETDLTARLILIKAVGRAKAPGALEHLQKIVLDATAPLPARVAALRAAAQSGPEGITLAIGRMNPASGENTALRLEAAYALQDLPLSESERQSIQEMAAKETDWRMKQALTILAQAR